MDTVTQLTFPCSTLPKDQTMSKLLGLYQQRQEGLWMQRIKITGGVLTSGQWAALANINSRYSPSTPMQLTTRQDIEFHNIVPDMVPLMQAELEKSGLSGLGACGDTLRNITICPGSGLCENAPDMNALAMAVKHQLENFSDIYSLPRKFKISFSACTKACAQPWINDLGFTAHQKNGTVNITAIGAGSLGPRPAAGITIRENMSPDDVTALSLAAFRLFNEHGNRNNRRRARLRHVREQFGDQQFLEMLSHEFDRCKKEHFSASPSLATPHKGYQSIDELHFPFGNIESHHAEAISKLTLDDTCVVRLQNNHRISVFAQDPGTAEKALRDDPFLNNHLSGPDITSCPGSTFCKHAIVNTHAAEQKLRESVPTDDIRVFRISGCPNGCAHSAIADIGLTGQIRKNETGAKTEGFRVFTGGGMGKTQTLAQKHTPFVPINEIADFILSLDKNP